LTNRNVLNGNDQTSGLDTRKQKKVVAYGILFCRGFESRLELGIFLFTTASRPALGPTQPPIQWVPGVNRSGCEADHSPPFSAEVKNVLCYTSTPPVHPYGAVLS